MEQTTDIVLQRYDTVYFRIYCSRDIALEINDRFSYEIKDARFNPKVKAGIWDGFIRLYSLNTRTFPIGLYDAFMSFCSESDYTVSVDGDPILTQTQITPNDLYEFVSGLTLKTKTGNEISVRSYQYSGAYKAIRDRRRVILSPTGSGKSLIQYLVVRYLRSLGYNILIVVPSTGLVTQLKGDFEDYSYYDTNWNAEDDVTMLPSEKKRLEKNGMTPILISTWHSLTKKPDSFFEFFDCVIVDEVQSAKANELQNILKKLTNADIRLGFTGTLNDCVTDKMLIYAMFGSPVRVADTVDLIDKKQLSEFKLKVVALKYSKEQKKPFRYYDATKSRMVQIPYKDEIKLICGNQKRNRIVCRLAQVCSGNTLILYNFREHGKAIVDMLDAKYTDKAVLYIDGESSIADRQNVGVAMSESKNIIAVASFGTFAAGVNIPSIENVILASPTKSDIRLLQSIGRGLRKSEGKELCRIFDIADLIYTTKTMPNYTYKHMVHRLKTYLENRFEYEIMEVDFD